MCALVNSNILIMQYSYIVKLLDVMYEIRK